ncbi:MAG: hypothetical protein AAFY99_01715 [Pseudomonadota bacterium]
MSAPAANGLLRLGRRAAASLSSLWVDRLCVALGVALVLAITVFGVLRPAYNWDMLAYVAAALDDRHETAETLHHDAWAVMEEGANPVQWQDLTAANPYNVANFENPDALQSQLVMFHVKPLYVWFIRAMEPLVGVGKAAIAASWLPGLLVGLFTIWWLARAGQAQAIPLVLPVFVMGDYFHMVTNVVPDMLHAAIALPALFLLSKGRDWVAASLLVIACAVRPDSVILTFAILLVAPFFGVRLAPIVFAFVGSLLMAKLIASTYDHIGWWSHFVFSTVELQAIVTGFDPAFSVTTLLTGYVRGLSVAFQHSEWIWLAMLLVGVRLVALASGVVGDRRIEAIFVACLLGLGGKFLSFPLPDDRFYFIFIAGMAVSLALLLRPQFVR